MCADAGERPCDGLRGGGERKLAVDVVAGAVDRGPDDDALPAARAADGEVAAALALGGAAFRRPQPRLMPYDIKAHSRTGNHSESQIIKKYKKV